jgi:nucleoside-diphosphate-sugar epimerase
VEDIMTVLITGGSGFIGLNLTEGLLGRGETVVLFAPVPPPKVALEIFSELDGTLHVAAGDIRKPADLDRAFATFRPDRVIHGAAITPGARRESVDPCQVLEVNILGTMRLLEAVQRHPVGRIVHLSSGAVYGANAFDATILDEQTTPPLPDSLYAITKYAGERLSLRFKRVFDLDLVAARLGTAFGPWEGDSGYRETLSPLLWTTSLARRGKVAVLARPGRKDWIYSRDVAAAVLALLDHPHPGHEVYNVGPGFEWTVSDWCKKLGKTYPAFSFAMEPDSPSSVNIDFHGPRDRAPLAVERLAVDIGFRARFGLDEAFDDYTAWADRVGDILVM